MMNEKTEIGAEIIEVEKSSEAAELVERMQIDKSSEALTDRRPTGRAWMNPRVDYHKLLQFYEMNVFHRRCIDLKANLVAGLGWELKTDDDKKEPDADHKRITALLERPNESGADTFSGLCIRFMKDYFNLGNAHMEIERNLKGEIVSLYSVRALTVRRDRNLKGGYWQGLNLNVRKVHYTRFGAHRRPGENQMLHFKNYDPKDDYYGQPDWYPSLADMIMDRAMATYYINLFGNQLMARFAVIVEGGRLSQKAVEKLKKYLRSNHEGIAKAGGTIILNSEDPNVKIRIEKLEVDVGKGGFDNSGIRGQSRDYVISAHGVPPRLAGIMQAGQLGGGGEVTGQVEMFKQTQIDPLRRDMEDYFNRTIIGSFGEHKWRLEFNELDLSDRFKQAEYWAKALNRQTGWARREEAREEEGFPPEEDGRQEDPLAIVKQTGGLNRFLEGFRESLESGDHGKHI